MPPVLMIVELLLEFSVSLHERAVLPRKRKLAFAPRHFWVNVELSDLRLMLD